MLNDKNEDFLEDIFLDTSTQKDSPKAHTQVQNDTHNSYDYTQQNSKNTLKSNQIQGNLVHIKDKYKQELKPINTRKSQKRNKNMPEISREDRYKYEQDKNRISIENPNSFRGQVLENKKRRPAFIENLDSTLGVGKKKKEKTKKEKFLEDSYNKKKETQKKRNFVLIREEVNNDIALHRVNLFNQILIAFRYKIKQSGRVKRREELRRQKEKAEEVGKYSSILRQLKSYLNEINEKNLKSMMIQINITSKQDLYILNEVLKREPIFNTYKIERIPHNPNLDRFGFKYKLPILLLISERAEKRQLEF